MLVSSGPGWTSRLEPGFYRVSWDLGTTMYCSVSANDVSCASRLCAYLDWSGLEIRTRRFRTDGDWAKPMSDPSRATSLEKLLLTFLEGSPGRIEPSTEMEMVMEIF